MTPRRTKIAVEHIDAALSSTVALARALLDAPRSEKETDDVVGLQPLRISVMASPLHSLHRRLTVLSLIRDEYPIHQDEVYPEQILRFARVEHFIKDVSERHRYCGRKTKRDTGCMNQSMLGLTCCHAHATESEQALVKTKAREWEALLEHSLKLAGVVDVAHEIEAELWRISARSPLNGAFPK